MENVEHVERAPAQASPSQPAGPIKQPRWPRGRRAGALAGPAPHRQPAVIEVNQLTKRFGAVTAVDGLSFTVRSGKVTAFLGPNGAGKTTTLRMILGLDAPTSGTALIGGRSYRDIPRPLHLAGSLLDATAVHGGRTAWHHLLALARSNGIASHRVREVLQMAGLQAVAHRRIGGFSLGMKQRLGIAAALLAEPAVLVLDEPVNGLDIDGVRWIRQLLRWEADAGRTIFISSHLMSETAMIADQLIIIGHGKLLADTPAAEFTSRGRDVLVKSPRSGELTALLQARGATVRPEPGGGLAVTGLDAPAIGDLAAQRAIPVHELVPRRATLEDAYLQLTEGSAAIGGAA